LKISGVRAYQGHRACHGQADRQEIRERDPIEQEVAKLSEVDGIGRKRIGMIKKAWADQKEIRQVMIFLQSHRVSSAYATKIFDARDFLPIFPNSHLHPAELLWFG